MAPPPPRSSGGETPFEEDGSQSSVVSHQSYWPPPRPDYPLYHHPSHHGGDPAVYLQRHQHFSNAAYSIHHAPTTVQYGNSSLPHPIHPHYGYMHTNSSHDDYLSLGSSSHQSLEPSFSFGDAMTEFSAPEILHSNSMLPPPNELPRKNTNSNTALGIFHDTEDGRKFVDEIFSDPQSPRHHLHQQHTVRSTTPHQQSPIASPDLHSVLSHESSEHPTVISTEGGEAHHHHHHRQQQQQQQQYGTLKLDENGALKFDENNPPSLRAHSSASHDDEDEDEEDDTPINVPSTGSSEDETNSIVLHHDGSSSSSTTMQQSTTPDHRHHPHHHHPTHHHHHQHHHQQSIDLNSMVYPDQSYTDGSASLCYDTTAAQQHRHPHYDPRLMNASQHQQQRQQPYQYPSSSSSMQKRISVMSPITMCFNRMLGAAEYIKTPGQPPQTSTKRCKRSASELSLDGSTGQHPIYQDMEANPFDELAADPELERLVILQMAMQRQQHNNPYNSDRPLPPMIPRDDNRIISEGFFWREYPACEHVLYNHMVRYYEISAIQRNYKVQQAFNNVLVEQVRKAAEDHGFEIDPNFDDKKLRDRIRCFYKTHLQNAKKRLATLQKHSDSDENRSLVAVFIRCVRDPTLSLEESLEMATTTASSKKRRLDKVEKLKMSVSKPM